MMISSLIVLSLNVIDIYLSKYVYNVSNTVLSNPKLDSFCPSCRKRLKFTNLLFACINGFEKIVSRIL